MIKYNYNLLLLLLCLVLSGISSPLIAQNEKIVPVPFGDMEHWMVRVVDESFIIGGNRKLLYEITTGDTLHNNTPYKRDQSPWATSTVMAKVSGVVKASVTIFPEKRGSGYCARLETRMEHVKVLGLLNLSVLATGTIFLGEVIEPVNDTKNPQSKLNNDHKFSERPNFLEFDYKVDPGGQQMKATGFGRPDYLTENNSAEITLLLQHRWEDANGNIFATRVGTGIERYKRIVSEWQNAHRIPVHYGNISNAPFFRPYMGLVKGENVQYCKNSKGIMVPIQEVGWAAPEEKITHIILKFSSGHGGAYIGAPGSKLWVDNIKLVY